MPKTKPKVSKSQRAQHMQFRLARAYSLEVLGDPLQRELYARLAREQERRLTPLLVSDFLTPPVVERIELGDYATKGLVSVLATDDVEVTRVEILIQGERGGLVEQGAATKVHGVWRYQAAKPAAGAVVQITATAFDRPGHPGQLTVRAVDG